MQKKNWNWFLKQLKSWYHPSKRQLPWKEIDDAYLVWVSEVFLQQTQADRVVEFFLRFTAKFPTVEDLAKASFEQALPYFRGLGFYGRLRRMIETAREVVKKSKERDFSASHSAPDSRSGQAAEMKKRGAQFPREIEELEKLPGIGPYTARAIASFAYGQNVLAPDTNVARILSRFWEPQLNSAKEKKWVMDRLDFFDEHYPEDFPLNQVLMDFGSSVCKAKKPKCDECPLVGKCVYGRDPEQFERMKRDFSASSPSSLHSTSARLSDGQVEMKKKRVSKGYQKIVVGILIQDKRVLVSRRKLDQTFAGLLEFPGGKVKGGEDERKAMQREFREEVGVEVSVRPPFEKLALHRQKQVLSFHRCRILTVQNAKCGMQKDDPSGVVIEGMEGQELMWIEQENLDPKAFLPANKGIIAALKKSRL